MSKTEKQRIRRKAKAKDQRLHPMEGQLSRVSHAIAIVLESKVRS